MNTFTTGVGPIEAFRRFRADTADTAISTFFGDLPIKSHVRAGVDLLSSIIEHQSPA